MSPVGSDDNSLMGLGVFAFLSLFFLFIFGCRLYYSPSRQIFFLVFVTALFNAIPGFFLLHHFSEAKFPIQPLQILSSPEPWLFDTRVWGQPTITQIKTLSPGIQLEKITFSHCGSSICTYRKLLLSSHQDTLGNKVYLDWVALAGDDSHLADDVYPLRGAFAQEKTVFWVLRSKPNESHFPSLLGQTWSSRLNAMYAGSYFLKVEPDGQFQWLGPELGDSFGGFYLLNFCLWGIYFGLRQLTAGRKYALIVTLCLMGGLLIIFPFPLEPFVLGLE